MEKTKLFAKQNREKSEQKGKPQEDEEDIYTNKSNKAPDDIKGLDLSNQSLKKGKNQEKVLDMKVTDRFKTDAHISGTFGFIGWGTPKSTIF